MTAYAVALTLPGEISSQLDELRTEFKQYVSYRIEPHLTLVHPFHLRGNLEAVNQKLAAVAEATKPFTLILDGLECFASDNNVVFVAIETKDPVMALHFDLIRSLSGLIDQEHASGQYSFDSFVPHVTIGEQLPRELMPLLKVRYADQKLHHEVEISSFVLFASDENDVWKEARSFRLSRRALL